MLGEVFAAVFVISAVCIVEFGALDTSDFILQQRAQIDIAKGKKIIASSEVWRSSSNCISLKYINTGNWWQIDLGKVYRLKYMNIHHTIYNENYFIFFNVWVTNVSAVEGERDPPYYALSLCDVYGDYVIKKSMRHITCVKVLYARYVIIMHKEAKDICKWEIFHCEKSYKRYGRDCALECDCNGNYCDTITGECICSPLPLYGDKCEKQCSCSKNQLCDLRTGACGKCVPGYFGKSCENLCPEGTWGDDCNQICYCQKYERCNVTYGTCNTVCFPLPLYGKRCEKQCPCLKNQLCDLQTGKCGKCVPGYTGRNCESVCPKGTWGTDCEQKCNCQENKLCNATYGTCGTGCLDHTYGKDCSKLCGKCLLGKPCKRITGRCPDNLCEPGFTGPTCDKPCPNGFYGFKCKQKCICSNASKVCNSVSGECTSDCAEGWLNPPVCNIPCPAGKYGFNCTQVCKTCFNKTEPCHHVTGKCSLCEPGKQPPNCEKDCEGKYGSMCRHDCRCQKKYCDPVSGACEGDCAPGYINDDKAPFNCALKICDEVGKHGLNCDKVCHCKDDAPCAQMTGKCPNGCAKNIGGKFCHLLLSAAKQTSIWKGVIAGGIAAILIIVAIVLLVAYKSRKQNTTTLYKIRDSCDNISQQSKKTRNSETSCELEEKQQAEEIINAHLKCNENSKDSTPAINNVDQNQSDDAFSGNASMPQSSINNDTINQKNVEDFNDTENHSEYREQNDSNPHTLTQTDPNPKKIRKGKAKRKEAILKIILRQVKKQQK